MSNLEEVKKILKRNTYYHTEEFGNSGKIEIMDFAGEQAAREIVKLFTPKPSEDRLLSKEEILAAPRPIATYAVDDEAGVQRLIDIDMKGILKAQRDLTASIKDAECQARVERILTLIEGDSLKYRSHKGKYNHYCASCGIRVVGISTEEWQNLKKQEGL
jgi:hypothetical protein